MVLVELFYFCFDCDIEGYMNEVTKSVRSDGPIVADWAAGQGLSL